MALEGKPLNGYVNLGGPALACGRHRHDFHHQREHRQVYAAVVAADVGRRATKMTELPAIRIRGLTKSFPGVAALRGVDLDIHQSEVHGLVGDNGAGKSTLIKHLTGLYAADGGSIQLFGRALENGHARALQQAGIEVIYQEQFCPN